MSSIENMLNRERVKLDIGCGSRKIDETFIGIDKQSLPGVDLVVNLEQGSLPLPTNSVDEIMASHVLEHVNNYLPLVEELWRIMKPGAMLTVKVPNYRHESAYTDPTHVRFFTPKSFNFFDKSKVLFKETGWYLSYARFNIVNREETEREIVYQLQTQKNRVLFVAPPDSIHTIRWFDSLSSYGYNIDVASRKIKGIANIAIGDTDNLDRVERFNNVPQNMLNALNGKNYDVVHAHFATCYGHALTVISKNTKKVLSVWGEDVLDESLRNPLLKERLLQSLQVSDHITTTSEHMQNTLIKIYSVPKQKIWIIPWGYKTMFKKKYVDEETYTKFGLSSTSPVITSGRICREQNNIENIVDAFMDANLNAQLLVLTGKIADSSYVNKLKNKTHADARIKYLDTVNEKDLVEIYNLSEAIISIPYVDQLSTTMLEALACGTPIICTNIPVYHERITSEKNGLFVDPDDIIQIKDAIKYFANKTIKESMSDYARESVIRDSWENNVKKLMSVYDAP